MRISFLLFIAASSWTFCVVSGAPVPTKYPSTNLARSEIQEFEPFHAALQNAAKLSDQEPSNLLSRRSSKHSKKLSNIPRRRKQISRKSSRIHRFNSVRKRSGLSAIKKDACELHTHRRDIFSRASSSSGSASDCSDEFAKKGQDHISLDETASTQEQVTETIAKGSKNLGYGSGAANNAGVYRLEKWGDIPGPHIAKKFHDEDEMKTEAKNLHKAEHLIASGDSHGPWAVMHFAPGAPLSKTKEYTNALKSSKEDCEAFMKNRHKELGTAVNDLYEKTNMLHADIKEENVHWTFDANGGGKAHLLDFGQMRHNPKTKDNIYKLVTAGNEVTPEGYGKSRAEMLYPLSKCPGH